MCIANPTSTRGGGVGAGHRRSRKGVAGQEEVNNPRNLVCGLHLELEGDVFAARSRGDAQRTARIVLNPEAAARNRDKGNTGAVQPVTCEIAEKLVANGIEGSS